MADTETRWGANKFHVYQEGVLIQSFDTYEEADDFRQGLNQEAKDA